VDVKTHWEKVYTTQAPESVSWYRAHLETSLTLVERAAEARSIKNSRWRRAMHILCRMIK